MSTKVPQHPDSSGNQTRTSCVAAGYMLAAPRGLIGQKSKQLWTETGRYNKLQKAFRIIEEMGLSSSGKFVTEKK